LSEASSESDSEGASTLTSITVTTLSLLLFIVAALALEGFLPKEQVRLGGGGGTFFLEPAAGDGLVVGSCESDEPESP
jgi:hypothetical protein